MKGVVRHSSLIAVLLLAGLAGRAEESTQTDKPTAPPRTFSGSLTAGFKAIRNAGDLNYFRDWVGERAGLTLHSATVQREWPGFRYFSLESLFTPENNSRVVLTFRSVENFRLRVKYDRVQNYFAASSTNFTPASPQLFSLPGDLTLRRTVGEVEWSWNLWGKALLEGGYRFRRSNGRDLQLVGGSYFTVLDSSLPTSQTLSTFQHAYHLGMSFPAGPFRVHLRGEMENLNARDSFPQPQIQGFALNRDLIYRNESHGQFGSAAATLEFSPRPSWYFTGGYLFHDLHSRPQWSRLELNRNFGSFWRRGSGLRAEGRYHGLFGQVLYTPRRVLALRYRAVEEWGEGFGRGFELRFENPVNQALTESLESRTDFESRTHREQVSASFYLGPSASLKARYSYDRRARQYASFFTPAGLNFTAGAAIREGEQTASVHSLQLEGRWKLAGQVQLLGSLGRRQFEIRQNDTRLVRHYFLGDRDTDTNLYRAGLKWKTTRRSNLEFEFRRENRDYSAVTAGLSPSRNTLDFDTYAVHLNLHPTQRWFVFGLLHYIRTDTKLLDLSRSAALATFSPVEYLVSNTGYLVGSNYLAFEKLNLGVQFQQNRAGGAESYRLHDVAASLEYDVDARWSLGARYQFFESNIALTPANNYRTHVAQWLLNYRF